MSRSVWKGLFCSLKINKRLLGEKKRIEIWPFLKIKLIIWPFLNEKKKICLSQKHNKKN